jgi:hypothetical protein
VGAGVGVAVGDAVGVGDAEGVTVGVGFGVNVGAGDAMGVGDAEGVTVGAGLWVGAGAFATGGGAAVSAVPLSPPQAATNTLLSNADNVRAQRARCIDGVCALFMGGDESDGFMCM